MWHHITSIPSAFSWLSFYITSGCPWIGFVEQEQLQQCQHHTQTLPFSYYAGKQQQTNNYCVSLALHTPKLIFNLYTFWQCSCSRNLHSPVFRIIGEPFCLSLPDWWWQQKRNRGGTLFCFHGACHFFMQTCNRNKYHRQVWNLPISLSVFLCMCLSLSVWVSLSFFLISKPHFTLTIQNRT